MGCDCSRTDLKCEDTLISAQEILVYSFEAEYIYAIHEKNSTNSEISEAQ